MRTVQVHLHHTTEEEVARFLQETYPFQKGPPWICNVGSDTSLYIDFNHHVSVELQPDQWATLIKASDGAAPISVSADVSGRCTGDGQVAAFVRVMLTRFAGFATDDYTDHLWTLNEIETRIRVRDCAFFDYRA